MLDTFYNDFSQSSRPGTQSKHTTCPRSANRLVSIITRTKHCTDKVVSGWIVYQISLNTEMRVHVHIKKCPDSYVVQIRRYFCEWPAVFEWIYSIQSVSNKTQTWNTLNNTEMIVGSVYAYRELRHSYFVQIRRYCFCELHPHTPYLPSGYDWIASNNLKHKVQTRP